MCTIHSQCIPSKHAGSGPEAFFITASYSHYGQLWPLRPVIAITASVQPESARVVYFARSDSPHPFQFRFSKEGMDYIVQNRPGSGLVGPVREQADVQARISGPGFWQNATDPQAVSHFQTRFRSFTNVLDNTVQNQPVSDFVLADCVRFAPNGSGPEASRCARIIRPASGQCFPAIRTGCKSDPACLLDSLLVIIFAPTNKRQRIRLQKAKEKELQIIVFCGISVGLETKINSLQFGEIAHKRVQ